MTPDELRAALMALPPGRAAEEARLAGEIRAAALALPAAAVALTGSADDALARRARTVSGRLEELAAASLLDADPSGVRHEVWLLQAATAASVALRVRTAARLRPLLADHRPVPVTPQPPEIEEQPRPTRVCDEAYLLLRELLDTGESRTQYAFDSRAFIRLDEAARDAELAAFASSGQFTRLTEDLDA